MDVAFVFSCFFRPMRRGGRALRCRYLERMVTVYFCLGALALFTVGFRLVKLGNPYKRGGGDPYTKRRMYRMLGWMMWTTAAVLVMLSLIDQLGSDQLPPPNLSPTTINPDVTRIATVTTSQRLLPNLLRSPALQAEATNSPAAMPFPTGSLSLSAIGKHSMSIFPSLLPSAVDQAPAPKRTSDFTVDPETEVTPAPAPASLASISAPDGAPASVAPASSGPATSPDVSPPPSPADAPPIPPAKMKQLDAVLAKADAAVKQDPGNVIAYLQRGNAYGSERHWDLALQDYKKALQIDPKCVTASFNMAELEFLQGHYDAARPGFLAIVDNADFGDLAKYKAFLCDLFAGHEQAAARQLQVFNQVGSEASYYFANVAWSLYHKKSDAAQNWWQSATQIFSPDKVNLYAKPLVDLGYIKVTS